MITKETSDQFRARVIAKAWADDGFKRRLLSDPVATLKAEGLETPAGLEVRVMEDTDKVVHYVLPARPKELNDADLDKVAGGRTSQYVAVARVAPGSGRMGDAEDILRQLQNIMNGKEGC